MILDTFLEEVAKQLAGESGVIPAYYAASTEYVNPLATDTSLPQEQGSRFAVTAARSINAVEYEGIKSGVYITTPSGEYVTGLGMFSAATDGTMLIELAVPTILQTTNFDIDIITTLTVTRR